MSDENTLGIGISSDGDTAVLSLQGELDPATAPQLDDAVAAFRDNHEISTIVLDLRELQFIDSSGLRVIIGFDQALSNRGARLVLREPSDAVRRLLEITDLISRLHVEEV